MRRRQFLAAGLAGLVPSLLPAADEAFDLVIRGGEVHDGSGTDPVRADVGVRGDAIVAIGDLAKAKTTATLDADGLAVAPGFINMLSWSNESLLADGRGQSEIRQGVTTEVMGEGWSMGPANDAVKKRMLADQIDIKYAIEWSTLGGYLRWLERVKVSPNVASYVGAATVRENVIGQDDRKPTPAELDRMRALVEQAMKEGALGVATALVYP